MEGTPLKKFGPYQVHQVRRGSYPTFHLYDQGWSRVLFSFHKGSIYFAAEKLATGKPIHTPREAMDFSLQNYALIYPSRFSWYCHTYATIGNGLEWVNGGLISDDVTSLTPEGREFEKSKYNYGIFGPIPEEEENLRSYLNGTWPDFAGRCDLYPLHDTYSRLGEMAHGVAKGDSFDPEWVEDARTAFNLLATKATEAGDIELLQKWSGMFERALGGVWLSNL